MLEAKKKITKKQMKEDKLVTSYYQVQSWFLKNQAKVLIVAGVIALVIAGWFLYQNKLSNDNEAASENLTKVIPLYEAGSFKEAIEGQKQGNVLGLKQIVDEFGGSESGEVARIYLANSYYISGQVDLAMETYDDYSGSNPLFKATSLAGMAACYESKENFEKAMDLYLEASKISKANPSNAEYSLKAAINMIKVNKKGEAKELLEMIKKDFPNTTAASEVDKYLLQTEN